MIIGVDKKSLQQERDRKYKEYANLLNSINPSIDDLNALKSELKYLDDQLNKINGLNDKKRTEQVKNGKLKQEKRILESYYAFKRKYNKINNMNVATNRIIGIIGSYNNQISEERVKVKI